MHADFQEKKSLQRYLWNSSAENFVCHASHFSALLQIGCLEIFSRLFAHFIVDTGENYRY